MSAIRGAVSPLGDAVDRAIDGARDIDASGLIAAPGYIDLQINGAGGHDFTSDPASIWAAGEILPRYGVTRFLPTIVTSPPAAVEAAQAVLRRGPPAGYCGAVPLGLHVEGPFLNPERRGVHDLALLRPIDRAIAADWSPDAGVRMVTLAPELPGAVALIRELVARGVVVSAGHSDATFEQGEAAIDAGVRYATHLFNGMPPLSHRAPGLVGALLGDDRVTVGLIPDRLHVHPAIVRLAWRAVGPSRFSAVTDAIAALGLAPGRYPLGSASIDVGPDGARSDGRLAGSVIGLDQAVRNLVAFAGATAAEAIGTVTEVPSRLLALSHSDDAVLLTKDLQPVATVVAGKLVWSDAERVAWA